MTLNIHLANWSEHSETLSALRRAVFIDEQNVSLELEFDGLDDKPDTLHFIAYSDEQSDSNKQSDSGEQRDSKKQSDKTIANGRLLADGQIGRICIKQDYRRRGYGRCLLMGILKHALELPNIPPLWLHAQVSALDLYRQCGFKAQGERFMEAGIEHQAMHFDHSSYSNLNAIFGDEVIRLTDDTCFSHHILQMILTGRRSLHILTHDLSERVYHQGVCDAVSQLARANCQAHIQILVQDTSALNGTQHPLVALARRLPSSISIHQLLKAPQKADTAFMIVDAQQLVFFNNEKESEGFATYGARPESKNALEEFAYLWQHHSAIDPNLQQLSI